MARRGTAARSLPGEGEKQGWDQNASRNHLLGLGTLLERVGFTLIWLRVQKSSSIFLYFSPAASPPGYFISFSLLDRFTELRGQSIPWDSSTRINVASSQKGSTSPSAWRAAGCCWHQAGITAGFCSPGPPAEPELLHRPHLRALHHCHHAGERGSGRGSLRAGLWLLT